MKARFGTVLSNKVQLSCGLPQGAPESPVIFTMNMELVLRNLVKSWKARHLAWRLDDFVLAAICHADDVVLASVCCSGSDGGKSDRKIERSGLTGGAGKTHWTSHPKMVDASIVVDGLAALWEEVLEVVGSRVCFDGNARHAMAHRTAQANMCLAKWRTVLDSTWSPRVGFAFSQRGIVRKASHSVP